MGDGLTRVTVRRAHPSMSSTLSAIAWQAKGHWGYPDEWMERWRDQLSVTPRYIRENLVHVALAETRLVGFSGFNPRLRELEHLWILPGFMGMGIGRKLFRELTKKLQELGVPLVRIVSDPNATGFYLAMGAVQTGKTASVPEGRSLPVLQFKPISDTG